jgi:hypothetical protein
VDRFPTRAEAPTGCANDSRTGRRRARPGRPTAGARAAAQDEADSISSMFLVTTSIVRPSSSVGLNSTTSVPA